MSDFNGTSPIQDEVIRGITNGTIESAEKEGINFLYDLEHSQNNLFFVGLSGVGDAFYRISNFSITPPSLSFERNNNRNFSLSGAKLPDEVTIEWIEDAFRSVEKFHLAWLRNWYDFNNDCVPIGVMNKFRDLNLTAFHYKNVNDSSSAPISKPEVVFRINLLDCVPTGMGSSQDFNWEGGGLKTLSVTYNVSKITYDYVGNISTGIGSETTTKDGYLLKTQGDRRGSLGNETTSLPDHRWLGKSAWDRGYSAYGVLNNPDYKPGTPTEEDIANAGSADERNVIPRS